MAKATNSRADYESKRRKTAARKKYQYEWNKKYRERNRQKVRRQGSVYGQKWRLNNPEKVKAAKEKYRNKNRHLNKHYKRRQVQNITQGYINDNLRKKGIDPKRSAGYNQLYKLQLQINRLLKQKL